MKKIIVLVLVAVATGFTAVAQTNNATQTQLQALVQKIEDKLQAGKNTEADLTGELKSFDGLVAAQNGAKTDEVAQIIFMKAMLYIEVLKNKDKGVELIKQIKVNYPDTKYGQRADQILASIAKQADEARARQTEAEKAQDAMFAAGKPFPDFAVSGLDGKPLSVGALKGKVVMVDFWATWCGPCRGELPNVIATYKKHHAGGFEIIGVSLDSDRDKLDAFLKKTAGMTWPQFFDGTLWINNKFIAAFGIGGFPHMFFVNRNGLFCYDRVRASNGQFEKIISMLLTK